MKKLLTDLREFLWPILEKNVEEFEGNVSELDLIVPDASLDKAYNLKSKMVENEEDRRKSIESKATLFISTLVIGSSLVVTGTSIVINQKTGEGNSFIIVSAILSFVLTVYTARTVWFAVKALERGTYSVLGVEDINVQLESTEYQRHIIKCLFKILSFNQKAINRKVNNMTMAQEYYKRAVILICIYSFTILAFCLLTWFQ